MRYYVKFDESGIAIGFLEYPYANETMTEVDFEEYNRIRVACGASPVTPFLTEEEKVAVLEHENHQLQSKLTATIQSNQLLEDCLIEMADIVYG